MRYASTSEHMGLKQQIHVLAEKNLSTRGIGSIQHGSRLNPI